MMIKKWKLFNDNIGFVALIPIDENGKESEKWIKGDEEISSFVTELQKRADKLASEKIEFLAKINSIGH